VGKAGSTGILGCVSGVRKFDSSLLPHFTGVANRFCPRVCLTCLESYCSPNCWEIPITLKIPRLINVQLNKVPQDEVESREGEICIDEQTKHFPEGIVRIEHNRPSGSTLALGAAVTTASTLDACAGVVCPQLISLNLSGRGSRQCRYEFDPPGPLVDGKAARNKLLQSAC